MILDINPIAQNNSKQNGVINQANVSAKIIVRAKKIIVRILGTSFCENNSNSKIVCDEIINDTESVTTNFDNKNVRYKMDCYILHTELIVIILLFIISFTCYSYAKNRSKLKKNVLL